MPEVRAASGMIRISMQPGAADLIVAELHDFAPSVFVERRHRALGGALEDSQVVTVTGCPFLVSQRLTYIWSGRGNDAGASTRLS